MKILVLHGFTQSGSNFRHDIRKLESHIQESFSNVSFYFATAPIQLKPSGMVATIGLTQHLGDRDDDLGQQISYEIPDLDDIDCYAWFKLHDHADPPTGFLHSLDMLAKILRDHGPFDGVLGFSQGGLMAIMIASLLEGEVRKAAFSQAAKESAETLPFPASFKDIQHPPLKFGITYGALMGVTKKYAPFYENPRIQTPFCQFSGLWDPVVSREMVEMVEKAQIGGKRSIKVVHPGAHNVCLERKYLNIVVDFIKYVQTYSALEQVGSLESVVEWPNEQPQEFLFGRTDKGVDISVRESSKESAKNSSSTRSLSDQANARSWRQWKYGKLVKGVRRTSRGRARLLSNFHEQQRSDDDLRSDSSSTSEEQQTKDFGNQPLSINDALEIFLDEWKYMEALDERSPSYRSTQEMAARILKRNMKY